MVDDPSSTVYGRFFIFGLQPRHRKHPDPLLGQQDVDLLLQVRDMPRSEKIQFFGDHAVRCPVEKSSATQQVVKPPTRGLPHRDEVTRRFLPYVRTPTLPCGRHNWPGSDRIRIRASPEGYRLGSACNSGTTTCQKGDGKTDHRRPLRGPWKTRGPVHAACR
jgi:hypothetical protein